MTANIKCCTPEETVVRAAEIMRHEDVGPVPVVRDHSHKKLVGVLTDRDIAIKVVAHGRDPRSTRVDQVMSTELATCRLEDDIEDATNLMSRRQLRRVMVVDDEGVLCGIIAQADIARKMDNEEVGSVVEDVSSRGGMFGRMFSGRGSRRGSSRGEGRYEGRGEGRYESRGGDRGSDRGQQQDSGRFRSDLYDERDYDDDYMGEGAGAGSALLIGAACLGIGAALMYLMDPERGPDRRMRLRDQGRDLAGTVRDRASQLRDQASNAVSKVRPNGLATEDMR
jgi:CBS domain-containing protein